MLNATFAFLPLPRCKSYPFNEQMIDPLTQTPDIIELSMKTREAIPDERDVRKYLKVLKEIGKKRFISNWMNPFDGSIRMYSEDATSEYLVTIWNYISRCQNFIIGLDLNSREELMKAKKVFGTLSSLSYLYSCCVIDAEHILFSPRTSDFIKAYNDYLLTVWQLALAILGSPTIKPKISTILRISQTCLQQVLIAEKALFACGGALREFFGSTMELCVKYFKGASQYYLAMLKLSEKNVLEAAACMYIGEEMIGGVKSDAVSPLAAELNTLKTKLHAKRSELMAHNIGILPDTVPFPKPPLPFTPVEADAELMSL